jgi:signal peptidase I
MDEQPQTNNPYPEPLNSARQSSAWRDTASTIAIILLAPVVAIFLTQFVFQSYMVDGPSMEATLSDGDRLIVTKTGKTWSRITRSDYIPDRYDIVIFNHSGEFGASQGNEKQLVKRVIGLPGDRVVVKDGVITVFNKERPEGFLVDREGPEKNTIGNTSGNIDETIGEGEVYVAGDNRENSLDSRSFGTVRSADLVGTLSLRIYPFDKVQKF